MPSENIKLQCPPELLQQWQQDIERNPQGLAAVLTLSPEYVVMLVHDAAAAGWLDALINNAQTEDFLEATRLEAAHQVARWGEAHDRGKSAENWFWLVGYLAGKCLRAVITGDRKKALHHTISSAAALLNWHKAITKDTTGSGIAQDEDIRPVEIARFESAVDGKSCDSCIHARTTPMHQEPCSRCVIGSGPGGGHADHWIAA